MSADDDPEPISMIPALLQDKGGKRSRVDAVERRIVGIRPTIWSPPVGRPDRLPISRELVNNIELTLDVHIGAQGTFDVSNMCECPRVDVMSAAPQP
jgi:hypothetical protein